MTRLQRHRKRWRFFMPDRLAARRFGSVGKTYPAAGNQSELRIATSADAEYAVMAKVLAAAKNAQVDRISFVQ